jgi:hypothetical protein
MPDSVNAARLSRHCRHVPAIVDRRSSVLQPLRSQVGDASELPDMRDQTTMVLSSTHARIALSEVDTEFCARTDYVGLPHSPKRSL